MPRRGYTTTKAEKAATVVAFGAVLAVLGFWFFVGFAIAHFIVKVW